jgi:hypothetical protein
MNHKKYQLTLLQVFVKCLQFEAQSYSGPPLTESVSLLFTHYQDYFHACDANFLPQFSIVNTRNVRAVFHRYNSRLNKGILPPINQAPSKDKQGGGDASNAEVTSVAGEQK